MEYKRIPAMKAHSSRIVHIRAGTAITPSLTKDGLAHNHIRMIKYIKSFFVALNANAHPGDIGHAVAFGLLLAFVPRANLLWAFLFFLTLFIRVNKGSFFLSLILLSFVTPLLDGPVEGLGYAILSIEPLQGAFAALYRTPFIGLTRFNNSLVAGSLAVGIVCYAPAAIGFSRLVVAYRHTMQPKIVESKLYKAICRLPLVKLFIDSPVVGGLGK